ncbi:MerR family transcriptional regulator [Inconstantimicrobium mannanitabidum]|uniref:MerR family transcriptional regulator n=1 Tax=Inconstantimicrobium mannanitabidum TaxID=1604901 RepID=A0ACB5RCT6_9CLOT|nr:MerR family transcriptional regulator [Clostridium sp. TW13]GKX67068.1 MerR family transcriptional regulator [Clostridium sp. TW13]
MSENINKYFNTGEFAKLCNIKKQTLFHYDDIGLFSPEIKTENGYRYYSVQQFEVFNVILALKELKMPLKEIKEYMDNRTPESLIDLFEHKINEVSKEIEHLTAIQKYMKTKIAITKKACSIDLNKITLELLKEEKLVLSRSINNLSYKDYLKAVAEHMDYCNTHHLDTGHSICAMISKENILKGVNENYSHIYTKLTSNKNIKGKTVYTKPKGLYAIAYHKGSYTTIDTTYQKILKYLDEASLTMGNFAYEECILDETTKNGYDNYVTQISVEIHEHVTV